MNKVSIVSCVVGIMGVTLFTALLISNRLSQAFYVILLVSLAMICIATVCLPRLLELDLKNLKMTLTELKQVKSDIEEVKAEIVDIYGGIENLRRVPLVLDDQKMKALGRKPDGIPEISAVMRYTAGCFKRERERLAQVFVLPKEPEKLAQAILDGSLDDKVFKWNGPEASLDAPPKSVEERENDKKDDRRTG